MMKLCETCRYGSEYELDKPCVVYRDDCPLYQKGEDMTIDEAIKELSEMRTDSRQMEALEMAIAALRFREKVVAYAENLIEQDARYYYGYVKIANILKVQAEVEPKESEE